MKGQVQSPFLRGSPWRVASLGVAAFVGVILIILCAWRLDPAAREEGRAANWIASRSFTVPQSVTSNDEVPAAGLARLMIRRDGALQRAHRWIWETMPKGIRTWIGLQRPQDSRRFGILAMAWLEHHQQRYEALPILIAAATDPECANHVQVMRCLREFGSGQPLLSGEDHFPFFDQALAGLESPDPALRLQMLERFGSGWPDHPAIRRRVAALRSEVGRVENGQPGTLLSTSTNRGSVPLHWH